VEKNFGMVVSCLCSEEAARGANMATDEALVLQVCGAVVKDELDYRTHAQQLVCPTCI
jgi:hypothetical protein